MVIENKKKKAAIPKKAVVKKKDDKNYPLLSLQNGDGESVTTHDNYTPRQPYTYKVKHTNGDNPVYEPFKLKDLFGPKFKLP